MRRPAACLWHSSGQERRLGSIAILHPIQIHLHADILHPDTETHFENVTVDLAKVAAAPPAPPMYIITGGLPATRINFAVFEARWGAEDLAKAAYHPAPAAQFTTLLEGLMSITTSDHEARRFRVGDVIRVEDTTPCRGHISVNESDNLLSVMIVR